jgi:hypothetical protein
LPKLRNNTKTPKVVRAIHPNAGVTSWYEVALQRLLREAIDDAVLMLTPSYSEPADVGIVAVDRYVTLVDWQTRTERAHNSFDDDGNPYVWHDSVPNGPPIIRSRLAMDAPAKITKVDRVLKAWGDKWGKKFNKLSAKMAKEFAGRSFSSTDTALKAALKDAGFTVSFKPTKQSLESYKLVVAENVGLIRNLQESLYAKIQRDTWASVRAGGDMATLSAKLHKSYGIDADRAALIARDQNNKAKAVLESSRRQELGLTKGIWQHSSGGKEPRPVHVAWGREGKVFDLDKGLFDPDEGEWVLPGTLINCRCTSRAVIPGFDDDE